MEYYSAIKKKKIMAFAAIWMELETLGEEGEKEKDKYHMVSFISGQNYNSKRYMYPYIHSSTIHNGQDIEIT